jgi:hypothetical protein
MALAAEIPQRGALRRHQAEEPPRTMLSARDRLRAALG